MIWVVVVGWIVCAVLSYGGMRASYEAEFPHFAKRCTWHDYIFGLVGAVSLGPLGLYFVAIDGELKYGFKFF